MKKRYTLKLSSRVCGDDLNKICRLWCSSSHWWELVGKMIIHSIQSIFDTINNNNNNISNRKECKNVSWCFYYVWKFRHPKMPPFVFAFRFDRWKLSFYRCDWPPKYRKPIKWHILNILTSNIVNYMELQLFLGGPFVSIQEKKMHSQLLRWLVKLDKTAHMLLVFCFVVHWTVVLPKG